MIKEDDNVLLLDDTGIKFKGTIDLIDNEKYYININDTILIFNLVNGYLEKENKLYYCKQYFIENNFIKINFYLEDLKKSNYLTKKLIYKVLEFNECECSVCLNLKIIKICNFLNDYVFENEIEKHLQKFISNNLLIYFINIKIQEIDLYIQNLEKNVKDNFIKKILNLKTQYDNSIHLHNTCCICLDEINDTNKFIINCPICNHIFCVEDCFEKFIKNDNRCPYCRIDLKEWIKIE
jgi:hypothetical protein